MKTYIQTVIALILPFISFAQDKGLDQKIDEAFQPVADAFFDAIFFPIYEGDTITIPFRSFNGAEQAKLELPLLSLFDYDNIFSSTNAPSAGTQANANCHSYPFCKR